MLLAACGSAAGASRAVIDAAAGQGWSLLTSAYVIAEVDANVAGLSAGASGNWAQIRAKLETVPDVLTFEWLGTSFYGLAILKPGDFLQRERAAGRLLRL